MYCRIPYLCQVDCTGEWLAPDPCWDSYVCEPWGSPPAADTLLPATLESMLQTKVFLYRKICPLCRFGRFVGKFRATKSKTDYGKSLSQYFTCVVMQCAQIQAYTFNTIKVINSSELNLQKQQVQVKYSLKSVKISTKSKSVPFV